VPGLVLRNPEDRHSGAAGVDIEDAGGSYPATPRAVDAVKLWRAEVNVGIRTANARVPDLQGIAASATSAWLAFAVEGDDLGFALVTDDVDVVELETTLFPAK
jgi:hypothetical protein